jgi:WhiB family redox-sensing transcriptional regulator
VSVTSLDWRLDAACRTAGTDLFFGPWDERQRDRTARESRAKAVCAACPSRQPCLEFALRLDIRWGVFGGEGERERDRLRAPSDVVRLCGNGLHLMNSRNTYVNPQGWKICKACRVAQDRRYRQERREAQRAA